MEEEEGAERQEKYAEEDGDADSAGMYKDPADYESQQWRGVLPEQFEEQNPDFKAAWGVVDLAAWGCSARKSTPSTLDDAHMKVL
jgi:hypothetical protein